MKIVALKTKEVLIVEQGCVKEVGVQVGVRVVHANTVELAHSNKDLVLRFRAGMEDHNGVKIGIILMEVGTDVVEVGTDVVDVGTDVGWNRRGRGWNGHGGWY